MPLTLGLGLGLSQQPADTEPPVEEGDAILMESGDYILTETGDKILLETGT